MRDHDDSGPFGIVSEIFGWPVRHFTEVVAILAVVISSNVDWKGGGESLQETKECLTLIVWELIEHLIGDKEVLHGISGGN